MQELSQNNEITSWNFEIREKKLKKEVKILNKCLNYWIKIKKIICQKVEI